MIDNHPRNNIYIYIYIYVYIWYIYIYIHIILYCSHASRQSAMAGVHVVRAVHQRMETNWNPGWTWAKGATKIVWRTSKAKADPERLSKAIALAHLRHLEISKFEGTEDDPEGLKGYRRCWQSWQLCMTHTISTLQGLQWWLTIMHVKFSLFSSVSHVAGPPCSMHPRVVNRKRLRQFERRLAASKDSKFLAGRASRRQAFVSSEVQ